MVKCCFNELVLLNYLFTPRARVAKHVQNRVLFNFCVKPNTLKMAATKKNLRKSLGKPGNVIATPEVGGRKYRIEVNVLYTKEAYMTRNKRFYSSGRLQRP